MSSRYKQLGQSMVEYTVILIALSVGLSALVIGDSQGLNEEGEPSLLQAMHNRYNEQSYAIRLTELPESQDLLELVAYYDEVEKYPELTKNINSVATKINEATATIDSVSNKIVELKNYQQQAQGLINQLP